ncbi:MAG: UDP-2,4-diacetamido-2,4,6-trideoxy-beta-L-altropyranose hydrolase [Clostridiaceae bacterium]
MYKIAIRADGGSSIGMGHIMRSLVLAKELAGTNDVFYICRKDLKNEKYIMGINKIREEGFDVVTIDENNVLDEISKVKADILITDSYDIDEEYFRKTKELFKKTVYVDDLNLYNFDLDIIINQNIGVENEVYKTSPGCKLLLGTKYLMLREEFRNIEIKEKSHKVNDILITFGGADPSNVTEKILDYIKDLNYTFHVVVGGAFKNTDNIIKISEEHSNIKLYFSPKISEVMQKCDIAISACSTTVYELSSLKIPILGVVSADNQIEVAKKMDIMGVAKNLGWFEDLEKEAFIKELINFCENQEIRNKIIKAQSENVNKNGVFEVVKEILQ